MGVYISPWRRGLGQVVFSPFWPTLRNQQVMKSTSLNQGIAKFLRGSIMTAPGKETMANNGALGWFHYLA
jgi:hypothetical protein